MLLPAPPIAAATGHDAPPERRRGRLLVGLRACMAETRRESGEGCPSWQRRCGEARVVIWTMPVFPRPGAMAAAVGRLV